MLVTGAVPQPARYLLRPDFTGAPNLSLVQKRGVLRVGISGDMPPFAFWDETAGEYKGFEVDLARHLTHSIFGCSYADVPSHLELVKVAFAERGLMLVESEVDVVIAVFADKPERRETLEFAGHYMSGKPSVLLSETAPKVEKLDDLRPLRVAALAGSTGEDTLREKVPDCDLIVLSTAEDCMATLKAGKAEAFWSSVAENFVYLNENPAMSEARFALPSEPWALAVRKGSDDWVRFINYLMTSLLEDGAMSMLNNRWFKRDS